MPSSGSFQKLGIYTLENLTVPSSSKKHKHNAFGVTLLLESDMTNGEKDTSALATSIHAFVSWRSS